MLLFIAAAALPLIAIGPDDVRLERKRTVVSEEARIELARHNGERVLCYDPHPSLATRARSICLTESQWVKATALAKTERQNNRGAGARSGIDQSLIYPQWQGYAPL
ncbi:hypothetical protein [Porphyrobacter sp. TH134]|uniref:hypothetical protein n=1 Tax=Porphyrobacter sp. TH134 TaxID=2067450 RepID=UPI00117F5299|nr:hypothetical protein [Porphyrobacter sp. TH134]